MGAVYVFSDIQSFCEKKPDANRFKSQATLFKGGQPGYKTHLESRLRFAMSVRLFSVHTNN